MMKNKYLNPNWKAVKLNDCFHIEKGSYLHVDKIKQGDIPFITAKAENNGVHSFIGNKPLFEKNALTIEKVNLSTFYQSHQFYCSHDVSVIISDVINRYNGLFISSQINRQGFKYSYGRQAQMNVVKKERILLPIQGSGKPDYKYMESYIQSLEERKEKQYLDYISKRLKGLEGIKKPLPLKSKKWNAFLIEDIAEIISGRDVYQAERIDGDTPYISATAKNNGIGYFVANTNLTLEQSCLSVNRNGSVGYSFYHPYKALFSNDCRKLRPHYKSKYVGLFLSNQITQQKDKYGYGYKMGTARLKKQKIMLPINSKREPDYEYMEQYMKYIEFNKIEKYFKLKNIICV